MLTRHRRSLWICVRSNRIRSRSSTVQVRVLDTRPPHTEPGLADRALEGEAPKLAPALIPRLNPFALTSWSASTAYDLAVLPHTLTSPEFWRCNLVRFRGDNSTSCWADFHSAGGCCLFSCRFLGRRRCSCRRPRWSEHGYNGRAECAGVHRG